MGKASRRRHEQRAARAAAGNPKRDRTRPQPEPVVEIVDERGMQEVTLHQIQHGLRNLVTTISPDGALTAEGRELLSQTRQPMNRKTMRTVMKSFAGEGPAISRAETAAAQIATDVAAGRMTEAAVIAERDCADPVVSEFFEVAGDRRVYPAITYLLYANADALSRRWTDRLTTDDLAALTDECRSPLQERLLGEAVDAAMQVYQWTTAERALVTDWAGERLKGFGDPVPATQWDGLGTEYGVTASELTVELAALLRLIDTTRTAVTVNLEVSA